MDFYLHIPWKANNRCNPNHLEQSDQYKFLQDVQKIQILPVPNFFPFLNVDQSGCSTMHLGLISLQISPPEQYDI